MVRQCEDPENAKGVFECELLRHVCWILGAIFAILGVIGDAANVTLVLEPISWLLLSVAAFTASVCPSVTWAVAWYLRSIEAKGKKKG